MRSLPRGHALIINNRYFVGKNMGNREGAEHDTENLKLLFEKLSFTVIVRENLTAQVFYICCLTSMHISLLKQIAVKLYVTYSS